MPRRAAAQLRAAMRGCSLVSPGGLPFLLLFRVAVPMKIWRNALAPEIVNANPIVVWEIGTPLAGPIGFASNPWTISGRDERVPSFGGWHCAPPSMLTMPEIGFSHRQGGGS